MKADKEITINGRKVTVEELIEMSIDGHMEMLRAQITGQEAGVALNKVLTLIKLGEYD